MALDKKYFDELAEIISENKETLEAFVGSDLHRKTTATNSVIQITAMLQPENSGLGGQERLAVLLGCIEQLINDPLAMSEIISSVQSDEGGKESELRKQLDDFRKQMKETGISDRVILDPVKRTSGEKAKRTSGPDPSKLFKQEKHPDEIKLNELLKQVVEQNKGKKKFEGEAIISQIVELVTSSEAAKGVVYELKRQTNKKTKEDKSEIITKFVKTLL